jgi:hypothetical protein
MATEPELGDKVLATILDISNTNEQGEYTVGELIHATVAFQRYFQAIQEPDDENLKALAFANSFLERIGSSPFPVTRPQLGKRSVRLKLKNQRNMEKTKKK